MMGASEKVGWRRPLLLAVAALAVVAAGAAVALAGPGDEGAAPVRPVKGCAEYSASDARGDSSSRFDGATGRLEVSTEGATFVFQESDDACRANPLSARLLENERQMENDIRLSSCVDRRQAIAEGRTYERGVRVNLDAARRYVELECN